MSEILTICLVVFVRWVSLWALRLQNVVCVCLCVCVSRVFVLLRTHSPLARAKELRESLLSGTFLENYAAGACHETLLEIFHCTCGWHSHRMALAFFSKELEHFPAFSVPRLLF